MTVIEEYPVLITVTLEEAAKLMRVRMDTMIAMYGDNYGTLDNRAFFSLGGIKTCVGAGWGDSQLRKILLTDQMDSLEDE